MKKSGINGHIYDSSADYDVIDVYEVLDICKYLMRKKWHSIKHSIGFIKKCFLTATMFLGWNLWSVNPWEFILMNNQECKVRFYENQVCLIW